ncbi:hypothetical protein GCM10010193_29810 [Kitasatospora atroaurantiaca]|uniref:Uncharacterized protein n=1 Tax=Kitasatospora atroaurantiaca TaxID=285545 RepID=A0A561EQV5_9ACTN|nr:hypothetical protein [Kitasatospora atroaurantiaca]TWE17969.1 hypothetical protein FB465_3016 [Kitasatospora atroaurantiaca]
MVADDSEELRFLLTLDPLFTVRFSDDSTIDLGAAVTAQGDGRLVVDLSAPQGTAPPSPDVL